ncbi:MAG TPA: response regulator [Candidatus Acidoferrales bacterium]|nr:response regulator [Candidatus Acidoferrales bacterium]
MTKHVRPRPSDQSHPASACPPLNRREKSEPLPGLFDNLEVGVAHVMPSGKIVYANGRFLSILGILPQVDVNGRNLADFIAPHSWEALQSALREAVQDPVVGELNVSSLSGKTHTVRLSLSPQQVNTRSVIRIVADEVTELVQANVRLRETEAILRALSARILQIQDQERRKMARDLHDTTGQELAVLVMSLRHLAQSFDRPGLDVHKALVDAAELANKVNDEIRTFSYVLHPPLLDQLGLGSALKWYVEGFSARSNIEVKLVIPENLNRFSPEKETALFRVVQEGLTNVLRHSGSNKAKIVVCTSIDEVEINVSDEGKGLSAAQVKELASGASPKAMGVGIAGLRERLHQLGGTLQICSQRVGSVLKAILPLDESEAALAGLASPLDSALTVDTPLEAPASPPVAALHSNGHKRILIVDDHEVMRRGIRALLENYTDLEICGEAGSGAEAIQKASQLDPDLIILDLNMPGSGGLSAANQLLRDGSRARILVFTTHSFPGMERVLRFAGCKGFVSKVHAERDLLRGVRAVLAGDEFYSPASAAAHSA